MRLTPLKLLLLACLALFANSCDQQLNSARDQPAVNYVLVVTDSASGQPLDSVRIRVTTITGDTSTYFTDREEGRVELATVSSSRTLFVLSRTGYQTRDSIDTVNATVDSIFHRPVAKLVRFRMGPLNAQNLEDQGQFNLFLRDPGLEKLRLGQVTLTDSNGREKILVDQDSNGTVTLSGLKLGPNRVVVEHPGFLGHWVDVNIARLSDTTRTVPDNTVILLPLKNSISGQVNFKNPTGSKGLQDALVVFQVKDSSAYRGRFQALTSNVLGKEGHFELSNLPPLEGELRIFSSQTAVEPSLIKQVTREEVVRDGAFAPVTLTLVSDSAANPVVDKLPADTLSPKDALVFHFNQPVVEMTEPTVRLINISQKLWVNADLDNSDHQTLKIVQAEDDWIPGKTYAYEVTSLNAQGQYFTRQGDTLSVVRGTFYVRDLPITDTTLVFPEAVRIAYFNSGTDRRFDSLHVDTSPKADSTSRFARLKWNWKSTKANRVDSLLVYVKDGGAARASWTQWVAIPGFADSATLDFSELYFTVSSKNNLPLFPLRNSSTEEIQLKVFFMEAGRTLDSLVILPPVNQGMGPSLYARYDELGGFITTTIAFKDTFEVSFHRGDTSSLFDFGQTHPKVKILIDEKQDIAHFDTTWVTNARLRVIGSFGAGQFPGSEFSHIRVDIQGELYEGKPIWVRNRTTGVGNK